GERSGPAPRAAAAGAGGGGPHRVDPVRSRPGDPRHVRHDDDAQGRRRVGARKRVVAGVDGEAIRPGPAGAGARGHRRTGSVATVKVYAGMDPRMPLREVGGYARRVEAMGYDGLHVAETVHDAFAASLLAAEHTTRIAIRTSVALAFVRSPLLTAYAAWDLARFSDGRFELGLGTQI